MARKGVVVKVEDLKAFDPPGHTNSSSWKLMSKDQCPAAAIFMTEMRPGAQAATHTHPYESWYIVISGRAKIEIAGETFLVGHNTAVYIPKETEHKIAEIVGNETWRVFVIAAPAP